jgi:hypothetical protein
VPVHFGIPSEVERVDVEVTVVSGGERRIRAIEGIEPADHLGSWLEIRG